jgi:hypothetical protein
LGVIRSNPSDLQTIPERIVGRGPFLRSVFFTRALSNATFLAYVNEDSSCSFSTWLLERDSASAVWFWSRSSTTTVDTVKFGSHHLISSVRYDNIYQLEFSTPDGETKNYELSVLNLNLMRWQVLEIFTGDHMHVLDLDGKLASTWLEDRWLIVIGEYTLFINPGKERTALLINWNTKLINTS